MCLIVGAPSRISFLAGSVFDSTPSASTLLLQAVRLTVNFYDVPEAKVAVVLGGSASAREYVQRLGRVLRKKGNAQAILLEIIARKTVDERIARRRRPK